MHCMHLYASVPQTGGSLQNPDHHSRLTYVVLHSGAVGGNMGKGNSGAAPGAGGGFDGKGNGNTGLGRVRGTTAPTPAPTPAPTRALHPRIKL